MKIIMDPSPLQTDTVARNEPVDARLAECPVPLHYHPFADLQSGCLLGLEACMPFPSTSNLVSGYAHPMIDCGLMVMDADDGMLGSIFRDLQNWKKQGFANVRIAISISLQQFRDPGLADRLATEFAAADLEPGLFCLQFTETHLLENALSAEMALRQLRVLGVQLVLDHFGAGFASLSYLCRYPFDAVRIDCSLIQALEGDAEVAATTKAVIAMARSLGLGVHAAGVTTEAQCDFLRQNMCDGIQGPFYNSPLSSDKVVPFLQAAPCLPEHLRRFQKRSRTLLLVDDEANILTALKRLLRRDGYEILVANGGQEGLQLLAENDADVIVSDQRMPGMTGVEFLGEAKKLRPDTVRIMLSGYTELQSVTSAINEGAIYKFLTKPWEDESLREHIADAFRHKEMADENRRLHLEVQEANHKMAAANRRLEDVLSQQRQQIVNDEASLQVVRSIMQEIPLAILGLDDQDMVVFANAAAQDLFGHGAVVMGNDASRLMPGVIPTVRLAPEKLICVAELNGARYMIRSHTMGKLAESRGRILFLTPLQGDAHGNWIA